MSRSVTVKDLVMGEGRSLALIAGPCVIESREATLRLAGAIADMARTLDLPVIFKASFDKANRSSVASFRGPGLEEGLRVLEQVREEADLPVTSDIHEPAQAAPAGEVLDLIQIPAFLCRQTDLLTAAGRTGKPVNVKKGQFMAPGDMKNVVAKLHHVGCEQVLLTERGVCFGYNNLVSDLRAIPLMQRLGCPVVYDATHSVQKPGAQGASSGGDREMIEPLALAAVAAGCDALFIETHERPDQGLSDPKTMLPFERLKPLLERALRVREALANG